VEDSAPLRALLRQVIGGFGYKILEAEDGEQALRVATQFGGEIPLLLTDVMMPRMRGSVLAKLLLQRRPKMGVLFMSGHSDDIVTADGVLETGVGFLQKPFTPESLIRKMRQLLDAPKNDEKSPTTLMS
jgi:two-component system cell cycle sensor histidine kinase/response regulator CckA